MLVERTRQTCKRGRGLHLLSVLMVELLVKCSFAAEAETIGLWDVFVDPHFSFRIHSSPAERAVPARGSIFPLRKQSPMRPFDRTAGQISQDTFPSPLFQTSKCPRDIFCIYNMNVCVSFISWVKYHSAPFPKIFWEGFDPSSPSPSSHPSWIFLNFYLNYLKSKTMGNGLFRFMPRDT